MDDQIFALKDISTLFTAQAHKKAEKFPLREVEETEKGHWVAFADDGDESYDVQITIVKGEVIAHSCDCGKLDAKGFCPHQLALLLHLSAKKSPTAKPATKRKVKEDPLSNLINQVEYDDLKAWVKEVLHLQKDLAIAFTNRFGAQPVDYTHHDIQKITDDAVKSVVKNKKKIDHSELKKILLLWKEVHQPIINTYLSHITSVDKIEILSGLMVSVDKWHHTFNINSTKISIYKKDLLAKTIQTLYDIENEESWKTIISAYFKEGYKSDNPAAMDWLVFLAHLSLLETRLLRQNFILDGFKQKYIATKSKPGNILSSWFTQLVFNMYKSCKRQADCIEWINYIPYENGFNLELIDALIENGFDKRAESLCRDVMKSNSQDVYNIPYLARLARLFKKEPRQSAKLFAVLMQMLPHAGDLEDFLIIKNEYFKNNEEAFKKWRTKIMTSLGHQMRYSMHDTHLYFDILHSEGKYLKMMEKIRDIRSLEIAVKFFDTLYKLDKNRLLKELSYVSATFDGGEKSETFFPLLAAKIKANYTATEIKKLLLKTDDFWKKDFVRYYEDTMNVA